MDSTAYGIREMYPDSLHMPGSKNGTLASFKMILMLNNGAKVLQFNEAGKCFSDKALEALKTCSEGTKVMFSEVAQVQDNGGRKVKGKSILWYNDSIHFFFVGINLVCTLFAQTEQKNPEQFP